MGTMRAAVLTGPQQFEVQKVETPQPGAGHVLLRVRNCGVCGSDLHFYRGEFPSPPAFRMGHEASGEIAAIGDGVSGLSVGQPVAIEPVAVCRACLYCTTGREQLCPERKFLGTMLPGAFAEFVETPAYTAHPLPDSVDFEAGALVEPLAVSVHGLRTVKLEYGERVAVLGSGTIGLMALVAARAMGASDVFVTARYPHQAEMARALGADGVIEAGDDAIGALTEAFGGRAPEVVVETVGGTANTVSEAITIAQAGGRVSVLGIFSALSPINATVLALKEVSLVGGITYGRPGSRSDFQVAIDIASRHAAEMRKVITHRMVLADIANAFATANDKSQQSIKVTVVA